MNQPDILDQINIDDFLKVDMRVGKVISVKDNEKAYKPAYILQIDFGDKIGVKQSSAQITNYQPETLLGRLVICIVNFPTKKIAGYKSEVLVLGIDDEEGELSLLTVDHPTPLGNKVY
jgi:tRNA-binding protein